MLHLTIIIIHLNVIIRLNVIIHLTITKLSESTPQKVIAYGLYRCRAGLDTACARAGALPN